MPWRAGGITIRPTCASDDAAPIGGQMKRVIREPLVQFMLIGILVFLLFFRDTDRPLDRGNGQPVIEITQQAVDRLVAQFESTWTRPPTEAEMTGLIDSYVREEVLYREALALGLDQDDPVIRQRLQMKMDFIGEAAAATEVPAEDELAAWYAAHAAEFAPAARVSFEQVMLSDPAEAEAVRAALAAGAAPAAVGRPTMLPGWMVGETAQAVDGQFGPGFFAEVVALPDGEWTGPVDSSFGSHLVRRGAVSVPETPPLSEVRDAALAAWRADRARALRDAQYAALRARYELRLPEAAE